MFFCVGVFFLLQLVNPSFGDHYKGGSISWKPTNPTSISGPTVSITITERHSWTLTRYACNITTIDKVGVYNDTESTIPPTLACISSTGCGASSYQTINSPLYCTDFSTVFEISSGTYYATQNLTLNSIIDIAWQGAAWTVETLTNQWSLVSHIDLTPISGKINTSPVTGSIPIFQTYLNVLTVIQIIVGDVDTDQVVRCRWATQIPIDECGNVCFDLTNASIDPINCFITWKPVLRPSDAANNLTSSTYVAAITVEDFANASSTIPISSVPHQVLVYASSKPASVCGTKPTVYLNGRRNLACYAVQAGSTNTYTLQGTANSACVLSQNDSIVDFISSSPFFTNKSAIYQISNNTWGVNLRWYAYANLSGLQPFCVAAVDNHGQASTQLCVMILVDSTGTNTNYYALQYMLSTASPVGTVMATQTRFSIQATLPLRRTTLNSTTIVIRRLDTNALAYQIDCKYSPDVYFINTTIVFFVKNPPWILGMTYYITLSQGVATANQYCGLEAGSFGNNNTWRFTIWNPSASSTTTPSTTTSTATTHTVTTRALSTALTNPLLTTTGIPAYTTTTVTTTTSITTTSATTSSTTSASTTTTTTTTTTEYLADVDVIYPKDFETQCLQPITIGVTILTAAFIPLHLFAMINLFAKMNSSFQKEALKMRSARRLQFPSHSDLGTEESVSGETETLV